MRRATGKARSLTLAMGGVVAVGCFLLARGAAEHRTAVGVERRLFALTPTTTGQNLPYLLMKGPKDSTLLALLGNPEAGPVKDWQGQLTAWGRNVLRLPGRARRLSLAEPLGTWEVSEGTVRRVWRYPTTGTAEDRYLMGDAGVDAGASQVPALLDLRTGRTYVGMAADTQMARAGIQRGAYYWEPWNDEEAGDPVGAFSPGIEGATTEIPAERQATQMIGGRPVRLITRYPYDPGETVVFAATLDAAPRLVQLVDRAMQYRLTEDGKALYFVRDGALWRLELRKPLPQLLDEAAPPLLPEPELGP